MRFPSSYIRIQTSSQLIFLIKLYFNNYLLSRIIAIICCSVLLYSRMYVYVCVSHTAIIGCCITTQRISSHIANVSGILFRRREKILFLHFLACYRGLGNRYDRNSHSWLHAPDLHRTRLQYFRYSRVREQYVTR